MALRILFPLLLLLSTAQAAADGGPPRDYEPANKDWNGLSEFAALAAAAGWAAEARGTLDWDQLDGNDVLVFLYPERPPAAESLVAFLASGGRALLADDFGALDSALLRLRIRRHAGPPPASVPTYHDNGALLVARPLHATALATAARELVTNHPAYFESPLPPTYAFLPGLSLVIEGTLSRGRFVALSDPSVLINNMLEIDGNRDFARALVRSLCRPGQDRLLILSGPLRDQGHPPAVLLGAPQQQGQPDVPGRLNQALAGANVHVQRTLARRAPSGGGFDAAALSGLGLAIAALLLLLRYLPLLAGQFDPGFARPWGASSPGGEVPGASASLPALVERYAQKDAPWGYLFPAALLREEVLRRLSPALSSLPRFGQPEAQQTTPAEVERHVAAYAGARAGHLAAALWREFRTLPGLGPSRDANDAPRGIPWVRAGRMDRLHKLAVALFAELSKAEGPAE